MGWLPPMGYANPHAHVRTQTRRTVSNGSSPLLRLAEVGERWRRAGSVASPERDRSKRRATPQQNEAIVERHGAESYFVIGEGLLGESGEGRPQTLAATAEAATPPFRFSRMGP